MVENINKIFEIMSNLGIVTLINMFFGSIIPVGCDSVYMTGEEYRKKVGFFYTVFFVANLGVLLIINVLFYFMAKNGETKYFMQIVLVVVTVCIWAISIIKGIILKFKKFWIIALNYS